jgi:2-polyprenyl-6-methoxyphenol hydroxylase-like FAD-dependent oxidoreductase
MKQYKIAIVGAGPAGYFTAQALQKAQDDENARLGNTLMSSEEQGRKNLALEVLRRLKK